MEVVAICSSPRAGGNTATLVEAMLEGAREAGTETVRFDAAKLKIGDCDADRQCLDSAEARCVLDDDMQEVYTRLQGAEAWIFATPIYFWNVNAAMKRVIDRLFAFYTTEGGWRLGLEGKRRGAVVVVQADADKDVPERIAEYLASVMRDLNVEVVGSMAEGSLGEPGDAAKRPELLARAKEIGRVLASGAQASR